MGVRQPRRGRGRQDDSFARTFFGTPWSAPLRFEVHSDFRREQTTIIGPRRTRPAFDVEAEFPVASAGAKATLKLRALRPLRTGAATCSSKARELQGDVRRQGPREVSSVRRPRKALGYYAATVSFGGTHFVRAGSDPTFIRLAATKRAIKFVTPRDYPRC